MARAHVAPEVAREEVAGSAPALTRRTSAERAAVVRELGRAAGNRAVGRYLLQRTPSDDPRSLDLQETFQASTRTLRKVEVLTTDAGDPKSGRAPSIEEVYWVEFTVNEHGVMRASARTVSGDGKLRSTRLRLGTEFNSAIERFREKGVDVKAFDAEWSYMNDKEKSTNLTEFENNLKANPKAGRVGAARQTPSGKVAVKAGFNDVTVGETTMEADPDIGPGRYPKVRARFAQPGVGPLPGTPTTSGTSTTGGSTPPARGTGGGSPSTTTTATRVKAGVGLAIIGVNIGLNWIIEKQNESRMKKALERLEPDVRAEQQRHPTMGFLLVFRFTGARRTPDGPSATGRFQGVSYRRAYTQEEAEAARKSEARIDPDESFMTQWIGPSVAPSPLEIHTPFPKVGLAKFAKLPEIEFQKVEFAEWGGFDEDGTQSVNASRWRAKAEAFRFIVLEMPSKIRHYDINRRPSTKSIDVGEASVKGGKVPVLMLDGDEPAVTVWPADTSTAELFQAAQRVDDKEGKLTINTNMHIVRWVRPAQVEIVQDFRNGGATEAKP